MYKSFDTLLQSLWELLCAINILTLLLSKRLTKGICERRCRLKPFGVRLAAVRRSAWDQAGEAGAEALLDAKGSWSNMGSLTAEADIVIVACSQDATSRGFVNQAFLSACKPGVIIVNVARGKTSYCRKCPHWVPHIPKA